MNIGALLDIGVPFEYLEKELARLGLSQFYHLRARKQVKMGIEGTKFDVDLVISDPHAHSDHTHHPVHNHGHKHDHTHIDHSHDEHNHHNHACLEDKHDSHEDKHAHAAHEHVHAVHEHRGFADIKQIIEDSSLATPVKGRAIAMFHQLAVAEAHVHGKTIDEVHFHEVGAVDAIVDIVGAAICLDYLDIQSVFALPPEVGSGFVKCAHGVMPVPAPATAELLKGVPFSQRLKGEATTPTGATILKHLVGSFVRPENFVIDRIGYGLGTKEFEQPNVLRVYLGTLQEHSTNVTQETQYLIETNIDDMNPEFYGDLETHLFAAGALDVFRTPIYMKKGRLGIKLSVLYASEHERSIMDVLFTETTTIGLRRVSVDKLMLQRKMVSVETPFGTITVKQAFYNGKVINQKPEYEELASLAKTNGMSIKKLYAKVLAHLEA